MPNQAMGASETPKLAMGLTIRLQGSVGRARLKRILIANSDGQLHIKKIYGGPVCVAEVIHE